MNVKSPLRRSNSSRRTNERKPRATKNHNIRLPSRPTSHVDTARKPTPTVAVRTRSPPMGLPRLSWTRMSPSSDQ